MRISDWVLSLKDIEKLFGIKATPFRVLILSFIAVFDCFRDQGEVALAFPPAAILASIAVVGIGTSIYAAHQSKKAGEEAAQKTGAEKDLEEQVNSMVTGVDRADVEGMVDQATTPIAGAVAAGQTQISQDVLASEGGGGAPSAYSGRAAVLKQQLANEGGGAVAQAALGAQQIAEQKSLLREEAKTAGMTDLASLGRQRKMAALQGSLTGSGQLGSMGDKLTGAAAGGVANAAGGQLYA